MTANADHIKFDWFHKAIICHNCKGHDSLTTSIESLGKMQAFVNAHKACPQQLEMAVEDNSDAVAWKSDREIEMEDDLKFLAKLLDNRHDVLGAAARARDYIKLCLEKAGVKS